MTTTATAKSRTITPPQVKHQQLLIGGKWLPSASGKTFAALNPATGAAICQVAEGDAADIDLAVRTARQALEAGPWKKTDAADRGRLLYKLADLIEKEASELAALESLNCGKTIRDSTGDMKGVINTLRYFAGWADKVEGRTVPERGNFLS